MGDWFSGDEAVDLESTKVADAEIAASEDTGSSFKDIGNSGSAKTVSYKDGPLQRIVLTAAATLTLTGFTAGKACRLRLLLKQDATGSRALPTFSPTVNWGTTGAPTLTSTANKTDMIDLISVDGGSTFLAVTVAKGF